LCLWTTFWA